MDRKLLQKELYTKEVETDYLLPGDIVAQDIYLRSGALVIKAGTPLNERYIETLRRMGARIVTIDLSLVYMNAVNDSKMLMKKASESKIITPEEVKTSIAPIIREVKRERNITRLLFELQSQDEYTFQHTINIGVISMVLAKWLGYTDEEEQTKIAVAGTMHDIGKGKIPESILKKPGKLTVKEFDIMKKHVILGYKMLRHAETYDESVSLAVLQHHERTDGSGYPNGLKGEEIHPYARIISVADVYHALTSKRVYRDNIDPFSVLDHLKNSLDNMDASIVLTFIDNMLNCLLGCLVKLKNGETAKVVFVDRNHLSKPILRIESSGELINLRERNDYKILHVVKI